MSRYGPKPLPLHEAVAWCDDDGQPYWNGYMRGLSQGWNKGKGKGWTKGKTKSHTTNAYKGAKHEDTCDPSARSRQLKSRDYSTSESNAQRSFPKSKPKINPRPKGTIVKTQLRQRYKPTSSQRLPLNIPNENQIATRDIIREEFERVGVKVPQAIKQIWKDEDQAAIESLERDEEMHSSQNDIDPDEDHNASENPESDE